MSAPLSSVVYAVLAERKAISVRTGGGKNLPEFTPAPRIDEPRASLFARHAPSAIFSAPGYQSALSGKSARTTSDVAYNASVYTGVLTYESFIPGQAGLYFTGGASAGAPQWAAITADADQAASHSLGFLNPTLYAIGANPSEYAADFHDVTVGDNAFNGSGFPAGTGYDLPTGLGTPNVANLIATLAG